MLLLPLVLTRLSKLVEEWVECILVEEVKIYFVLKNHKDFVPTFQTPNRCDFDVENIRKHEQS